MKNKILKCILFIVNIALLYLLFTFPFMKFTPIKMEEGFRNELVNAPELVNKEFNKNLQILFEYYDITYRIDKNSNIYIPLTLYFNKELKWNYTTKALDKEFLAKLK